ncbi:MAG: tRNA (adenosine(37)-N6)-threonylcarbamoyltransferase complex transferase subunit TsaD [Deltaproteobacteria bacterium]|nr:tRNA (adenosine(37)-N6)-threonylcarbamoyltransferase complex transferase subunit TsaD [Deltaproteobacteria bacterium]
MIVLGIETSCDETAAAVVVDGTEALSNVVVSQIEVHREFGGVVPELASRKHVEAISMVISKSLKDAGVDFGDIDAIAVTRGPGLIGALLVGIGVAKGLSLALNKPICGVNHLHGHLFAVWLDNDQMEFPFVGMVVSGGHTTLFEVRSPLDIDVIGKTRDDAAGEAYDKVAKLLGLGYPGGAIIEKLSEGVSPDGLRFPRALIEQGNLDFSFSGLKTAVLRQAEKVFGIHYDRSRPGSFHQITPEDPSAEDQRTIRKIAAAFQDAVIDTLVSKLFMAVEIRKVSRLVVCGGVAANQALRNRIISEGHKREIKVILPSMSLCADNAAMIGARGNFLLQEGIVDSLGFGAKSRW